MDPTKDRRAVRRSNCVAAGKIVSSSWEAEKMELQLGKIHQELKRLCNRAVNERLKQEKHTSGPLQLAQFYSAQGSTPQAVNHALSSWELGPKIVKNLTKFAQ